MAHGHSTAIFLADHTDPDVDREHIPYLLGDQRTPVNAISTAATTIATDRLVKATHQYELWHQRLVHAPASRLYNTSKLVVGLPTISPTTLPSFIRYRACDIAKLRKGPKGHPIVDPPDMQPGQNFSMDLGFMRGPENLQAVVARTEDARPKIIHSRQGYTCYLLIMDRKLRYMWAFPLKSRAVSTNLMSIFLQTHGNSTASPRIVRTGGEGSLAESTAFRNLVAKNQFILQKATDISSQNGTAERPHQSLGNMVSCMLYAAAMPVEFWADALVYAVYITNRLHHSGIDAVLYTAWTGKWPDVSHLRVFGAHVTVRCSGMRPTQLDPHFFTGRFLRFGATVKNIIYYDDVTHRVKVARHCSIDELHYGTDPIYRPPMASTIIKNTLPTSVIPPADDTWLQAADSTSLLGELDQMDPNSCELCQSPPQTVVAAVMFTSTSEQKRQFDRVLALDSSTDSYGPPIWISLPMNRLPTLGLVLQDTPTNMNMLVIGCQEGAAASRLPRWRSMFKDATIRIIGIQQIRNKAMFVARIASLRQRRTPQVHILLARHEVPDLHTNPDIPQLHYDQLHRINSLQNSMARPRRTGSNSL